MREGLLRTIEKSLLLLKQKKGLAMNIKFIFFTEISSMKTERLNNEDGDISLNLLHVSVNILSANP